MLATDTLCPLVWKNIDILQDSSLAPCCYFDKHKRVRLEDKNSSRKDYFDNGLIKEVKTSMLNNERPVECSYCYECETEGINSPRLVAKGLYPDFDSKIEDHSIDGLHLRLSNACDLSCRNCNAFQSTSWNKDHLKINIGSKPINLTIFKDEGLDEDFRSLLSSSLNLYLSGGEPLLDKNIREVLEIYTSGRGRDGVLQIQTNLAREHILTSPEFQILKNHGDTTLVVSVDAVGSQAEYLRKGLSWDIFDKNLKRLFEISGDMKICLAVTMSIHNVFSILDIFQYLISMDKLHAVYFEINLLDDPMSFSARNLPEKIKKNLEKEYMKFLDELDSSRDRVKLEPSLIRILNFLKLSPIAEVFDFFLYSKKIDNVRNEDTLATFPFLNNLKQL